MYRLPHSDPADNKETLRKEMLGGFLQKSKAPDHEQAEKKEGKGYYKVSLPW
jgi:hypothetical protein